MADERAETVRQQDITDDVLLTLWRSVQGPQAGLTGPLIRFANAVAALASPVPSHEDSQETPKVPCPNCGMHYALAQEMREWKDEPAAPGCAQCSRLRIRLRQADELQKLTQDNQVRWMEKHTAVEAECSRLREALVNAAVSLRSAAERWPREADLYESFGNLAAGYALGWAKGIEAALSTQPEGK